MVFGMLMPLTAMGTESFFSSEGVVTLAIQFLRLSDVNYPMFPISQYMYAPSLHTPPSLQHSKFSENKSNIYLNLKEIN